MTTPSIQPAIEVRHLSKSFGQVQANRDLSLSVGRGEIVGLLGENGAGKSTLLSILAGFQRPDAGEIAIDGKPVVFTSPASALAAGIGLVHQHFSLVPSFTVREQLELAGWSKRALPPSLGDSLNGNERIEDLAPGRRQRVEIAKALVTPRRLLLLDEPTSILAPSEVGALFSTLEEIRRDGTAIVIVTHKLREMLAIVDRIVVMTSGSIAGEFRRHGGDWPEGTEGQALDLMFGRDRGDAPDLVLRPALDPIGDAGASPLLSVRDLSLESMSGEARSLRDISFALMPGEFATVVGIDGQGQVELAETLCGYRQGTGTITLDGVDVGHLPAIERASRSMAYLVDDRLGEGAVGEFSVRENVVLKRPRPAKLLRRGVFRQEAVENHARSLIERWDIRPPDPDAPFAALSGGNMQRVLAGRELDRRPRLLVAINPVGGLDVRSTALVWERLRGLCKSGAAVLAFTSDLDEAIDQGDRVAVMYEGRLSPFERPHRIDFARYGSMMVNGW